MAQKKILMIVGDYVEDYEVMVPFHALLAVGHVVHAVCPRKRNGDKIITSIHDFEGAQTYSEKPGHYFVINETIEEAMAEDYDALVLPGGRSPEYLRTEETVIDIVQHFLETDKPIAAICHGLQILAAADGLRGKTCTAYPACAPEVTAVGGKFRAVDMDEVVVDGNLITAPAWPALPNWIAAFLQVLGTRIEL